MTIVTEAEARTKICPQTFSVRETMGGYGREAGPWNCIASNCMAWRWAESDAAGGLRNGFCGAFGIPEFAK